jgi:hypothetical protein
MQIVDFKPSTPARLTVAVELDIRRDLRSDVYVVMIGPAQPREHVRTTIRWVLQAQDDPLHPWQLIDANQLLTRALDRENQGANKPFE